jgi:hypothetical protein
MHKTAFNSPSYRTAAWSQVSTSSPSCLFSDGPHRRNLSLARLPSTPWPVVDICTTTLLAGTTPPFYASALNSSAFATFSSELQQDRQHRHDHSFPLKATTFYSSGSAANASRTTQRRRLRTQKATRSGRRSGDLRTLVTLPGFRSSYLSSVLLSPQALWSMEATLCFQCIVHILYNYDANVN